MALSTVAAPHQAMPPTESNPPMKPATTSPIDTKVADATLMIHLGEPPATTWALSLVQRLQKRLMPLCMKRLEGLTLTIHDFGARNIQHIDHAGPVNQLTVPSGSCAVIVRMGQKQRSYFFTIAPHDVFDLYLALKP